jgi:subtilisin family serine protease
MIKRVDEVRLLVSIVIIALLAGVCFAARPSLLPKGIEEIRAAAEKGDVVVIVTLEEPALKKATPALQLKERKERSDKIREKVLDDLEQAVAVQEAQALADTTEQPGNLLTANVVLDTDETAVEILTEYATTSGFTAKVNADGVEALANTPGIKDIKLEKTFQLQLAQSVPLIRASDTWNRTVNGVSINGKGQTICVVDTGLDYGHAAFSGRILEGRCFLTGEGGVECPNPADITNASDDNDHGTHVAGIAAGNGTYVGVAPGANIIAVKACNSTGGCFMGAMTAGIDHCINISAQYNISAITLSISDGGHYDTINDCPYDENFENAVNTAYGLGIIVSMAAGNSGGTGIGWPACIPNATSVSATDKSDVIPAYSQTGALLDILAPGSSITSTVRGGYAAKTGTSMATPHIAGAAALLWQNERLNNRAVTPGLIEDLMKNHSSNMISGWPRINVLEVITARNLNMTVNTSANSVVKLNAGSIKFKDTTDLRQIDQCVNLSAGRISVDSASCPQFNKNATLQLFGLGYTFKPVPLLNGTRCTDCNISGYASGTFEFNVTHFSEYSAGPNTRLVVWDDTDTLARAPYQTVAFYANYTNITSGASINGTGVVCAIMFNTTGNYGSSENMTFDATRSIYIGNHSFSSNGNFTFNALCNGTTAYAETLNATDNISVTADVVPPAIRLVYPQNASTINASSYVRFVFNATDDSGSLANCSLLVNGTINTTMLLPSSGINQTINATLANGSYSWRITCSDNSNNTNTSNENLLTVDVPPLSPTSIANFGNYTLAEDASISINVSDHFNISDGSPLTYSASQSGLTVTFSAGNATVSGLPNASGVYYVVFVATSQLGMTAQGNNTTITITPVNDPPIYGSTIADQSWTQGSNRTNAFDLDVYFSDIDNSTLNYTASGTSSIVVSIDPGTHIVSLGQPSTFTGTEHVTFKATDGQYNATSNSVTLTVSVASSSGGGGGGGGGGCNSQCSPAGPIGCSDDKILITCADTNSDGCLELTSVECAAGQKCSDKICVACISAWSCVDWSACANGKQTRSCVDRAACNSSTGRPAEIQDCAIPQPQVAAQPPVTRPALVAPLSTTSNESTGNATDQLTGAAINDTICGDGICQSNEWCMADCKSRNTKGLIILTFSLGIIGIVVNHILRLRAQKP